MVPWLLAAIFLALAALPAAAISDPGIFEPEEQLPPAKPAVPSTNRGSAPLAAQLATPSSHELLSAVYQGHPVSLPHGCYRTSDLIGKSSVNPWSADVMYSLLGSAKARKSRLRSELVLCPVPKAGSEGGFKLFSVAGYVEVAPPAADGETAAVDQEAVRHSPALSIGDGEAKAQIQLADDEASWPPVGQEAEGYWRQRDGRLEWEAPPPEPMPLVAPEESNKLRGSGSSASNQSQASDGQGAPVDPAQAYDAWTASIGGESADDWLSFEEWRQRHQAEKARAEAEKRAENKQKKKQAKQAAAQQSQPPSDSTVPKETVDTSSSAGTSHVNNAASGLAQSTSSAASPSAPSSAAQSASPGENSQITTSAEQHSPLSSFHQMHASSFDEALNPSQSQSSALTQTSTSASDASSGQEVPPIAVGADPAPGSVPAQKDPSTSLKTLRHRWNFASMDCAAVIHRTNPAAKFASAILNEKKDRYMLSPCPGAKPSKDGSGEVFVVVELCDEISIDTVVLANHEFFSRMFKRFKVSVAPALKSGGQKGDEEWRELGVFRARNARGPQVFNITSPSTGFFRYVRIDFLEYYGNEYYCPLSLLRVYGLTQLDHFRREEEKDRKALEASERLTIGDGEELEEDDEELDVEDGREPTFELPEEMRAAADDGAWDAVWPQKAPFIPGRGGDGHAFSFESVTASPHLPERSQHQASSTLSQQREAGSSSSRSPSGSPTFHTQSPTSEADRSPSPAAATTHVPTSQAAYSEGSSATSTAASPSSTLRPVHRGTEETRTCPIGLSRLSDLEREAMIPAVCFKPRSGHAQPASSSAKPASSGSSSNSSATNSQQPQQSGGGRNGDQQTRGAAGNGNGGNSGSGSESIYRTITKRLNALEANATLSLQYIEHSGQMLREVFRTMEKRQEHRLGDMLRALNSSNWRQIEALKRRQQVDLQRAIFEFDVHKQQIEAERRELLTQVTELASEIRFERRLGVVQLLLVLGLFGFMATTRGPASGPGSLHAQMGRLATSASQPRSFRSLMSGRGSTPSGGSTGGQEDNSRAGTPTLLSGAQSPQPLPGALPSKHESESSQETPTEEQVPNSLQRESRDTTAEPEIKLPVSSTAATATAATPIPTGDFAEMSPAELRSYLGFNSPRGPRSQTPAGDAGEGEDDENLSASLHDETGDEGLETAFEDHDSEDGGVGGGFTLDAASTDMGPTHTIDALEAQKLRSAAHRINVPGRPLSASSSPPPVLREREPITPGKVSSRLLAGAPSRADALLSPPHAMAGALLQRPRSATAMEVRFPRRRALSQSPDSDASSGDEDDEGHEGDRSTESGAGGWQKVVNKRHPSFASSASGSAAMGGASMSSSSSPTTPQRPRPRSFLGNNSINGSISSSSSHASSRSNPSPRASLSSTRSSSNSGGIVSSNGPAGIRDDYASRRWSQQARSPPSSSINLLAMDAKRGRTSSSPGLPPHHPHGHAHTVSSSLSVDGSGATTPQPGMGARSRTTSTLSGSGGM